MLAFLLQTVPPVLVKLTPFKAALFMFSIMFGAVMAIRTFIEWPLFHRPPYLTKFWSFRLGDAFGFTIFGFVAAYLLRKYKEKDRWFDRRMTQIIFGFFWGVVGVGNYLNGFRSGTMEEWRKFAPSEMFHSGMFGVTGTIISHALLSLFFGTTIAVKKKLLAVVPLSLWVGGVIADVIIDTKQK